VVANREAWTKEEDLELIRLVGERLPLDEEGGDGEGSGNRKVSVC